MTQLRWLSPARQGICLPRQAIAGISEAFGSQLAESSPVTVTLERTRLGPDDDGRGVESDIASSRRLNFCEVAAFDRHLV
ncbi:hypothetical protein ACQRIU_000612 [Beauveria bassiana]